MFWKAYEKSAFLICEHIRPFKTSKKCVKSLGSACMISIGFPDATEEQLFRNLERLRSFDLALATPMDCMMLVAELKKMLH